MINIKDDIVFIDKPVGITSFDVLRKLKKKYDTPKLKLGHAGTLDPNASGLMVIGVGLGTKKLKEYVGLSKEYIGEILIGTSTTTSDAEGEILEDVYVPDISEEELRKTVESMVGVIRLRVSKFSAVKMRGEPLYKKAHRGEDVKVLPLRDMQVNSAELISYECRDNKCILNVKFNVESGVYIRSLAEEVGRRLGYPATLKNLRRTKVGEHLVEYVNEMI